MVIWLPFYDLGAGVGFNQPNHPMDVKLFLFLSEQIRRIQRTANFVLKGLPMPQAAATGTEGQNWIQWLYAFCKSQGYNGFTPLPGQMSVQPQHSESSSLMVTLNKLYYKHFPDEFIDPKFSQPTNGSINASDLIWHMSRPECQRSPWFDLPKPAAGPQRELAFFDLSALTTLALGPQGPWTTEYALLVRLLKYVAAFHPSLGISVINSNADYLAPAFHLFREKVCTLGWPVEVTNCPAVNSTGGSLTAPSIIRPLNYFSRNNPNIPMGPWYKPLNADLGNPPALASALKTCPKKSRIFSQ